MAERKTYLNYNIDIDLKPDKLSITPKITNESCGLISLSAQDDKWDITSFVLEPDARKKGLGTNLFHLVEDCVSQVGGKSIYIDFSSYSHDGRSLASHMSGLRLFLIRKGFKYDESKPLLLVKQI